MRLNIPKPLLYWGFNPFDEIVIASKEGALAIFLHEYFQGKELEKKFKGAKISIKPNARGKTVVEK